MIRVTTLGRQVIWINPYLVRLIESSPDTILCFTDGHRLPVLESPEWIQGAFAEFCRGTNDKV